ncbi:MAG: hypothetical protein A2057_08715 [Ignavibacteria bacterium GWA2_35_9]|nr:MAG: hypothetical protein A2057_08715 [Ignavibacteria bacterium GWA2_35_9]
MKNILAVFIKEIIHIRRDLRTLYIAFIYPILVLVLFGFALKLDLNYIPLAVGDFDNSSRSRELISRFVNSRYFTSYYYISDIKEIDSLINKGKVWAGLIIPADFSRKILKQEPCTVELVIDASDNNVANQVIGFSQAIVQQYSADELVSSLNLQGMIVKGQGLPLKLEPRVWYNPELQSTNYFVPSLIAVIMMMITTVLTSLTIAKEFEIGTIESLLVSPLRKYQILLGKMLPYIMISLANWVLILMLGIFYFNIPFKGSLFQFFLASLIFLFLALNLGLLISTIAKSQQTAWMLSLLGTMLPSFLLSGFIFPIENMPVLLQLITYLVPVRYFLVIIRGMFLKGIGVSELYREILVLVFMGIALFTATILKFKKSLG